MKLRSRRGAVWLACVVVCAQGCSPANVADEAMRRLAGISTPVATFSHPAVPVAFELFRGARIYLPVTVSGSPTLALLDSGAGMTVLDAGFAKSAGIEADSHMAVGGAAGGASAGVAHHVVVAVGGLHLRDVTVLILDLKTIASQIGHPLQVILGREAFDASVVDVDFADRRVNFVERRAFAAPAGAVATPLKARGGGARSVPVSVEGRPPIYVGFDLGNGGSLTLDRTYWEEVGLLGDRPSSVTLAGGVGGVREHRIAEVRRLEFAGATLNAVPVLLAETADEGATLGARVLSRFHLWIDYAGDTLFSQANPRAIDAVFPKDRAGLVATVSVDRLVVTFVAPSGPAARAGLKAGDEILALNGRKIGPGFADSPLVEWADAAPGTRIELRLQGGREVALSLADYF
ncbi:MAG TPA: aspartyl protease family protein [Caulobacteraceae bacterium]|jgi:hypothetical protein|nr:aspartyl protease family protein [Caulobacteraceae bacterium]